MTIGSNLYPTDYPRLKPVPTYGCPGTNHSLLESTESNATVNPVITTMTGRFDYILTNYSKLPPMAENRTAAAPLEVQSKDDGRVLNGRSVLMGRESIFITCLWHLLSELYCNCTKNHFVVPKTCFRANSRSYSYVSTIFSTCKIKEKIRWFSVSCYYHNHKTYHFFNWSTPWLFRVSFLWYHVTGVLTTLVLGIVLSVLSGSYHMAAIMKFFNSGEYDFLMSLVYDDRRVFATQSI